MQNEHIVHVLSHAAFERMQAKHNAFVANAKAKATRYEALRYEFRKGTTYCAAKTGEPVTIEDVFKTDIHIAIEHTADAESAMTGIAKVTKHVVTKQYMYEAIQEGRLKEQIKSRTHNATNRNACDENDDIKQMIAEISSLLDSKCNYEHADNHKFETTSLEEIKERMLNENVTLTDYDN